MRSSREVGQKLEEYKRELALAIAEKAALGDLADPDLTLVIFSLVDKIEALFWVLEIELPDGDIIERLPSSHLM